MKTKTSNGHCNCIHFSSSKKKEGATLEKKVGELAIYTNINWKWTKKKLNKSLENLKENISRQKSKANKYWKEKKTYIIIV